MANTGYYVRIDRDGKKKHLDITELTDDELAEFFGNRSKSVNGWWAATLAAWIRENNPRIPEDF